MNNVIKEKANRMLNNIHINTTRKRWRRWREEPANKSNKIIVRFRPLRSDIILKKNCNNFFSTRLTFAVLLWKSISLRTFAWMCKSVAQSGTRRELYELHIYRERKKKHKKDLLFSFYDRFFFLNCIQTIFGFENIWRKKDNQ